jgi:transcriptional regulator with XRE-family HTH domain
MMFGEKLKELRLENGYTQEKLAELADVSKRTIINYEQGRCYPKQTEIVARFAEIFSVPVDFLFSDADRYVQEAEERGGSYAAQEVSWLLSSAGAMFAGGSLSEEDKDKVIRKLNELYWDSKEKNRAKYGKNAR